MANDDKKKRLHEVAKRNFEYVPVDYEEFSKKASNPDFSRRLSQDLLELEKGGFIKKAPTYDVLISAFGATPAPTATTATPATPESNVVPGGGPNVTGAMFREGAQKQAVSQQRISNMGVPPVGDESGMPPSISGTPGQAPVGGQPGAQESAPQGGVGVRPVAGEAIPNMPQLNAPIAPQGLFQPPPNPLAQGQYEATIANADPLQAPITESAQATTTSTGGRPMEEEVQKQASLATAMQRGYGQAKLTELITLTGTPTYDEVKQIAQLNRENAKLPVSDAMKAYGEDPSIWNGLALAPEVALQSLVSMGVAGWKTIAGMTAAGAGAGAAPTLGVGAIPGAAYGFGAGMTAAGVAVEVSNSIIESLQEQGVDTSDEKELYKAFNNPRIIAKAKEYAVRRGIPILIFDAASAGLAGQILKIPTKTFAGTLAKAGGETATQMAGGGLGEAGAQLLSGKPLNRAAIQIEAIGEIGTTPIDIALSAVRSGNKDAKVMNRVAVTPDINPDEVNQTIDFNVASGAITQEQGDKAKADFAKAQEINAKIPADISNPELRTASIGLIEERESLQAQLGSVDEAFKPAIEAKIKGINEQLQALSEVPAIEQTQSYFDTNQPTQTNPILTLPDVVDNVLNQIDEGILISAERLYEVSTAVNQAIRETLANKALKPEERNATLNLLSGMLSDIDKANTEGQKFVEEVEVASVQDRVPAVRPKRSYPKDKPRKPLHLLRRHMVKA